MAAVALVAVMLRLSLSSTRGRVQRRRLLMNNEVSLSFVHAIEYAVCRILRDCFALLRGLSALNTKSRSASRSLFNYRTKVFETQPLVGTRPLGYADQAADEDGNEAEGDDGEYGDLINTEEQFDRLPAADAQMRVTQRHTATRSLLAASPFLPSLKYRRLSLC